ncbi:MAG: CHAP domain-containing protein [Candidatus Nanogingivalaceae bacterium]|jgi:choline binding protein D|nr:CHAP domain-containing protein [Candidatus Nanogingivalaceae bacterium]
MKHRSTTPVSSKQHVAKSSIVAAAVLMSASIPVAFAQNVLADKYDDQVKKLQSEADSYQQRASTLGVLASTLQAQLDTLTKQKNEIQAQINTSQAKRNKLEKDIAATEKKIAINKEALGEIVADMYVDSSISPLEMLASSKNIGDYVDKQEYRSSMQDNLNSTIKQIKSLRSQLEKQKKQVENVLRDQKSQKNALAAKEAEQAKLVSDTRGEESAYNGLVAKRNNEISSVRAQQAAAMAAAARQSTGGSLNIGAGSASGGGYPAIWANAEQDTLVDNWGLYNRECVSYTAWKVASTGRYVPHFGGAGNANQWPSTTARYGIANGSTPKAGSVAIWYVGAYGHAMYVEAVNGDGTITVSDYNNNMDGLGWGRYHYYTRSAAGLTYIYF